MARPSFPYRRIADELRAKILDGDLGPGERLPSEHKLAEEYRTTRSTVRKAIALLKADGLVVSRQGQGSQVRPRPRVRLLSSGVNYRERRGSGKSNFNAEVEAQGQRAEQRILEVDDAVDAPPEIVVRLELGSDDDRVLVRRRLFVVDGEPVQMCDGYYLSSLVHDTPIAASAKIPGGVHAVIEDPKGPIRRRIARFVEDIEVRMPTPSEAEVLEIPSGVPVAHILRTAYDSGDVPVEVLDSLIPCDRHVFRYVIDVPVDSA